MRRDEFGEDVDEGGKDNVGEKGGFRLEFSRDFGGIAG